MMISRIVAFAILLAWLLTAGCVGEYEEASTSPYAGQETRTLKALSSQEVEGYLEGRGMGFSKVAELNQYPGPKHILELSEELDLEDEQHREIEAIFQRMRREARELGQRLVSQERQLDSLFANESATPSEVEARIQDIGELRANLRYVHVRAHMEAKEILTSHQVERYDKLRGYHRQEGQRPEEDHSQHGL